MISSPTVYNSKYYTFWISVERFRDLNLQFGTKHLIAGVFCGFQRFYTVHICTYIYVQNSTAQSCNIQICTSRTLQTRFVRSRYVLSKIYIMYFPDMYFPRYILSRHVQSSFVQCRYLNSKFIPRGSGCCRYRGAEESGERLVTDHQRIRVPRDTIIRQYT